MVILDGLENKDYLVGLECQAMPQSLVIQVGQDGQVILVGLESLEQVVILDGLENKDYLDGLECQDMLQSLVILDGLDGQVVLVGLENQV